MRQTPSSAVSPYQEKATRITVHPDVKFDPRGTIIERIKRSQQPATPLERRATLAQASAATSIVRPGLSPEMSQVLFQASIRNPALATSLYGSMLQRSPGLSPGIATPGENPEGSSAYAGPTVTPAGMADPLPDMGGARLETSTLAAPGAVARARFSAASQQIYQGDAWQAAAAATLFSSPAGSAVRVSAPSEPGAYAPPGAGSSYDIERAPATSYTDTTTGETISDGDVPMGADDTGYGDALLAGEENSYPGDSKKYLLWGAGAIAVVAGILIVAMKMKKGKK